MMEKAEAAMIAALSSYNKPDSHYREETFALLAGNAWELLLKAKLLSVNGNKLSALHAREPVRLKDGSKGKGERIKRNRTGNPLTISLGRARDLLEGQHGVVLPAEVKANIDALTEIRDNSAHFVNSRSDLAKVVLEIGTASLMNFVQLAKEWFEWSFGRYRLFLMPIGFVQSPATVQGLRVSAPEAKLLAYLRQLVESTSRDNGSDFFVSMQVDVSMKRSASDSAAAFRLTQDTDAPAVHLSDTEFFHQFPWPYMELTKRLVKRYSNFIQNQKYHDIRNAITSPSLVQTRFLDPESKRMSKKYFSPNVLDVFDKHYERN